MSNPSYTPVPQQDFIPSPPAPVGNVPPVSQQSTSAASATGGSARSTPFVPVVPSPATVGNVVNAAATASAFLPQRYTVEGLRQWRAERFHNVRPWSDFLDKSRVRQPGSWTVAQERMGANWATYQGNYMVLFLVISLFCLISSPFLLFVIGAIVGAHTFLNGFPGDRIQIGGNAHDKAKLKLYLNIASVPLLYFASAGGALLWVAGVAGVVIGGHAAMLEPPVERAFTEAV
ncbi:hypothetical protein RI367_006770 [Sorochytrium milnesiophthora]